ncbi:hypothetical protein [Thiomicrorhabdus sp.]|uniref:hypothetical protein n=1 Tax=Thiomicrorhabdus sp. TaxID=2039724 RepID=UPI0029C7C1E6|nr:hypothetical protein [Thiomicrorhabdus sp.]
MKYFLFILLLTFSKISYAVDNPWDRPLPFKNATVEYKVEGSMQGSKTVYIRESGRESAEYSDLSMSMFGMKQQQKELVITTPDWVYHIDFLKQNGTKQTNPLKYFKQEFEALSKSEQKTVVENAEKTGMNMVAGMQGEVQKNAATLHGYKCDLTKVMGSEVYSISGTGFPLKMVSNVMGIKQKEEVIKLDKSKPPAAKFEVPKGVKITVNHEADKMAQQQAKEVIQHLLKGEDPDKGAVNRDAYQQDPDNELSPEQQQQLQQMMKMFGQ